jgi:hypothetical protein
VWWNTITPFFGYNMDKVTEKFLQIRKELEHVIEHKVDDELHKVNGPACIWKYGDYSGWALFGKNHRYYGPAATAIGNNERWWLHGDLIK